MNTNQKETSNCATNNFKKSILKNPEREIIFCILLRNYLWRSLPAVMNALIAHCVIQYADCLDVPTPIMQIA